MRKLHAEAAASLHPSFGFHAAVIPRTSAHNSCIDLLWTSRSYGRGRHMLNRKTATLSGSRWLLAAFAIQISGCLGYNNTSFDTERTPIVNTGARASIIYPGQSAPAMPGSVPQGQPALPGSSPQYAPNTQNAQPTTPEQQPPYPSSAPPTPQAFANPQSGSTPDGQISFLGGSRIEASRHVDIRKEPLMLKYLKVPFKLVAAPFVLAKEALEGEPEPGPAIPRRPDPQLPRAQSGAGTAPPPQPSAVGYESARLEDLERQLDRRRATDPREAPPRQIASAQRPTLSIADELRELQRAPEVPSNRRDHPSSAAPSTFARTSPSGEPANPFPAASGIVIATTTAGSINGYFVKTVKS